MPLISRLLLLFGIAPSMHAQYIPGSYPGFALYEGLPVDPSLASGPPLCDTAIVARACHAMSANTPEMYTHPADSSSTVVHAREIAYAVASDTGSVVNLLNQLHINTGDDISCQELCEKLVADNPPKHLPAVSDVGCWTHGSQPVCDVDVSDASLDRIAPGGSRGPDVPEDIPGLPHSMPSWQQQRNVDAQKYKKPADFQSWAFTPHDNQKLKKHLLSLFHIHQLTNDKGVYRTPETPTFLRRLSGDDTVTASTVPRAIKAKAYVTKALQKMANGEADDSMKKWFGSSQFDPTREALTKILSEASEKLDNMEFVYPGQACVRYPPKVVAYVEPLSTPREGGRWLVHICDHYFKLDEGEQVTTIIHEASHFTEALTRDHAYGTRKSMGLAGDCTATGSNPKSHECIKARTNADSVNYFVSNVVLGEDAFNEALTNEFNIDGWVKPLAIGVVAGLCLLCVIAIFRGTGKSEFRTRGLRSRELHQDAWEDEY